MAQSGVLHERFVGPWPFVLPLLTTVLLGVACNVLEIPLLPDAVGNRLEPGLRDRLWRSRFGGWLARRLGAPERTRLAGAAAFRATEAALGEDVSRLADAQAEAEDAAQRRIGATGP